jgi:hypothetical protein
MEIADFRKLSTHRKGGLVWRDGIFLDDYPTQLLTIKLYSLYNFYVEVQLFNHDARVREITAFTKEERLEKYLEKVTFEVPR